MNANEPTKTCNHATNGSLRAFAEGFCAVTNREPEEYIDYRSCCCTLDEFNTGSLTDEQIGQCRTIGEQQAHNALKDEKNWTTLKLRRDEIEELVRWHESAHVDWWLECHDHDIWGGCISGSGSRRAGYANARLDYFYFTGGVGEHMWEIKDEVWRQRLGEIVRKCDCDRCLNARDWLFPELAKEWKQKSEEPQWEAFAAEVRRKFPRLHEDESSLLIQRTIQSNTSPEPAAEAACRAVELHARWQSDYNAWLGHDHDEEEAMREAKPQIDGLLAKWRGEVVAPTEPIAA
jgi:hypothetical protein